MNIYNFNRRSLAPTIASFTVVLGLCLGISSRVGANTQPSAWLSVSNPTLLSDFDLNANESLPTTVAGIGNRDCQNYTVITKPARLFQPQSSITNCFVATKFGIADSNGLIRFTGAKVAGRSINYGNYAAGMIAIPNSSDTISYTSSPYIGLNLHFNRALPLPLTIEPSTNGEVTYRFNRPASASLKDKSGNLLSVSSDSLSFSSNGKWMVVDMPSVSLIRVNLETLEVLPFMPSFNYQIGVAPGIQSAISNDGRYAIVSSTNFSVFSIYDLSTCGATPATISGPVSCQSRPLLPFMKSQISSYIGAYNIRFTADEIVSMYVYHTVNGVTKATKYNLLAPGQATSKVAYLGLGDSFTSGEGDNLGGVYYEPGTDQSSNLCHLSTRSYPYLIKTNLAVGDFHSVSCSGALIRNINDIGPLGAQYPNDIVTNIWQPGYKNQLAYLAGSRPNYLTLMIGGNDVGFAEDLIECATSHAKIPLPNTCKYAGVQVERDNVAKLIADQFTRLKSLYEETARATDNRTKIYVVGYPQFIKESGGSCGINVHLNDQEREFVAKDVHYMNQVIKAAADTAGVYYLDIEDALAGKNLCSIVPDSQMAVNGVTEGNDSHLPWWSGFLTGGLVGIIAVQRLGLGNESFHPNSNGHVLMSNKIMGLTGNDLGSFIVCPAKPTALICPKGDGKVPLPDSTYFSSDARSYVDNLNSTNITTAASPPEPSPIVILDSTSATNQIHIHIDYLLPNSSIKLTIQSVNIATITANASGSVDQTVTIPQAITSGFDNIYASAINIAGEAKTYFQHIFIPGPINDINSNGIIDSNESCGFSTPSGIDIDQDGIDDACDGTIGVAPPQKLTIIIRQLGVKR